MYFQLAQESYRAIRVSIYCSFIDLTIGWEDYHFDTLVEFNFKPVIWISVNPFLFLSNFVNHAKQKMNCYCFILFLLGPACFHR